MKYIKGFIILEEGQSRVNINHIVRYYKSLSEQIIVTTGIAFHTKHTLEEIDEAITKAQL